LFNIEEKEMKTKLITFSVIIALTATLVFVLSASEEYGKYTYDDFETPEYCGACHNNIYQQWQQSMMSVAFTHEWDDIEYFELALPHSELEPKVAEVKEGCNGCHSPLAFMTGDIPPKRPSEGTRANESVSCEVCHNITGFTGDIPYNFNYVMDVGKTKYSGRKGETEMPSVHEIKVSPIMQKSEFCGICHNEKSPFGTWVKSTHLEWKESPYAEQGVQCQDCHMSETTMKTAAMGPEYNDAKMHLFQGAHSESKLRGTVEIGLYSAKKEAKKGDKINIKASLFNQKAGHKIPTGSVEDRIMWLHVEAIDSDGNKYHIPVVKKGFEGEEYTIASEEMAYQDMGVPLGIDDFQGLRREEVPVGDRIFRMAYFDPEGRMTIQQWNTASLGVDYRIGPKETILEDYSFVIPESVPSGNLQIKADLYYRLVVKPVAEYLKLPESEYKAFLINSTSYSIAVK
jgi:nitrate/TMAO reductase-like tetraheme cytochrome c subunit